MKKVLFLLILGIIFLKSNAQECGTQTNYPNKIPSYTIATNETFDNSAICVRVFFHIVRNSAGTNGFNTSNIQFLVNGLNQVYNLHNIVIVNQGNDVINNDTYGVEFNDGEYNSLVQLNNVPNAINIYLLPVDVSGSPAYAGKANGIPGNALVVSSSYITTSSLPHELGHCLNLFHTHHQVEAGGCDETSSDKSCSSCGDFVCDTPIDPVLSCGSNVNAVTCTFIGGGYSPLTNNIMSYSCKPCRNAFTSQQGARMRTSLTYDPILANFRTVECISITGSNPLCTNGVYTLNNAPAGSSLVWSINLPNIASIIASGNACTVTKNVNGLVTLTCSITTANGTLIISKNITIGTGNSIRFSQNLIVCETGRHYYYGTVNPVPFAGNNYKWYAKDMSNPSNPFILKQENLGNTADFPLNRNGRVTKNYTIRVVATTTCGDIQSIDAEGLLYAAPCAALRIAISPNPSSGLISLNYDEELSNPEVRNNFKVFDLIGNLVYERNYTIFGKKQDLDLSKLKKGNYMLKITNGKEESTFNIILR